MSTIENLYDTFNLVITENFGSKIRLRNPDDLTDNEELHLKDGFAVKWGPATENVDYKFRYIERLVSITFTKKIFRLEMDTAITMAAEKLLLNEMTSMVDFMIYDERIIKLVEYLESQGDEGIEQVYDDKKNVLKITNTFLVKYTEG